MTLDLPAETLQAVLAIAGWVVAFLLGRELATGYQQWRAYRRDQSGSED